MQPTQAVKQSSSIEVHTISERVGGRSPSPWIAWDVKIEGIFMIEVRFKVFQPAGSCICSRSSIIGETGAHWVEKHRARAAEMTL